MGGRGFSGLDAAGEEAVGGDPLGGDEGAAVDDGFHNQMPECGSRNTECGIFECGMRNVECGMERFLTL